MQTILEQKLICTYKIPGFNTVLLIFLNIFNYWILLLAETRKLHVHFSFCGLRHFERKLVYKLMMFDFIHKKNHLIEQSNFFRCLRLHLPCSIKFTGFAQYPVRLCTSIKFIYTGVYHLH